MNGWEEFWTYFDTFIFIYSLPRSTIRDKIIPHAVSWFTGEAIQDEEFEDMDNEDDDDEDNDDDEDDEDEDDEDEDDDDEDEDEDEGKSRKKVCHFF